MFANISEARHRSLRRDLQVALRLEQEGVYDTQAIQVIVDGVFERSQRKSLEDHMAEEMEIALESYGQIATRRMIDRSPMNCWEVFRSLVTSVQEALWKVTDEMLVVCMQETNEFAEQRKAVHEELAAMNRALEILESVV